MGMPLKRSLELDRPSQLIVGDSPLLSGELVPLPLFRDQSSAEQFVDRMAAKLGLPCRVESLWVEGSGARRLTYEDAGKYVVLSVTISPGRVVEGMPTFWFSGFAKRKAGKRQLKIPSRLRPKHFKRDVEHILGELRRQ